jgi:hypothetical protein
MVDVSAFLEAFLSMFLRSACFMEEPPPPSQGKKQNFGFGTFPQVPDCQDFQIIGSQLKEFGCVAIE